MTPADTCIAEAVVVVDGSTAVVGVSGADDDDDVATRMMNSDDEQMVPVDPEVDAACSRVIMQASIEEDRTTTDGGGDGPGTPSACKFFLGFDVNRADSDAGMEQVDATENHHQGPDVDGDSNDGGCLGNLDDVEHEQVLETTNCCDEEHDPDHHEDHEVDESLSTVVADDQDTLPAHEMCSDDDVDEDDDDDDDDTVDDTEQFCDAESGEHVCGHEEETCCDSVSDSVSFQANGDEVGDELPGSRSDSMLCRLPQSLDAVQESPDSGNEDKDVVSEHSSGADPHLLAVSPLTSSPTSPASVFDHPISEHRRSISSPVSSSKPPPGALVARKSLKSESAERSPKSPDYAYVQGQKVELRPPKVNTATKRVSSFRKSLINLGKYVSFLACDCEAVTHAIVIDLCPSVRLSVCQTRGL